MLVSILLAIAALVGGYFFVMKYDSIEEKFFGEDASSGQLFVFASGVAGALMAVGIFAHQMFNFDMPDMFFPFVGGCLLTIVYGVSVFDAFFTSSGYGRAIGKMVVRIFGCGIGALMGAAVSVILIIGVVLWIVLKFFGAAMSSSSSSSSSSSQPQTSQDEMEISVDGEMFSRKAKDEGFGVIRDDRGDRWRKGWGNQLEKID